MVAGGLTGAIVTGLLAGSAGCAVGSVAGNLADANFLDNRACLDCGHTFREDVSPTSVSINYTPGPAPTSTPEHTDVASHAHPGSGHSLGGRISMNFDDE
jgi:hypothetical protein